MKKEFFKRYLVKSKGETLADFNDEMNAIEFAEEKGLKADEYWIDDQYVEYQEQLEKTPEDNVFWRQLLAEALYWSASIPLARVYGLRMDVDDEEDVKDSALPAGTIHVSFESSAYGPDVNFEHVVERAAQKTDYVLVNSCRDRENYSYTVTPNNYEAKKREIMEKVHALVKEAEAIEKEAEVCRVDISGYPFDRDDICKRIDINRKRKDALETICAEIRAIWKSSGNITWSPETGYYRENDDAIAEFLADAEQCLFVVEDELSELDKILNELNEEEGDEV